MSPQCRWRWGELSSETLSDVTVSPGWPPLCPLGGGPWRVCPLDGHRCVPWMATTVSPGWMSPRGTLMCPQMVIPGWGPTTVSPG